MTRRAALGALFAALLPAAAASTQQRPAPFRARYRVAYQGIAVGTGSIALRYDADGGYRMRSEIAADGWAALLFSDTIVETAAGTLTAAGPRPRSYRYTQTGGRRERVTTLAFDWPRRRVVSVSDGDAATLPLGAAAVDPLSVYLQVMWRLQRGEPAATVTLVVRHRVRDYRLRADGRERLTLPAGPLETRRYSRQRPGSSRLTRFWLAPRLGWLPVQVVQYRDGGERLRLTLTRIDG